MYQLVTPVCRNGVGAWAYKCGLYFRCNDGKHNAEYGGASCQTDNGVNPADRTFGSGDEERENMEGSRINQTTAGEEIRLNI